MLRTRTGQASSGMKGSVVLRELTRQDWLSILHLEERHIPETVILRGTRNLRRHFDKYRRLLTNPLDVGSPNGLFEDITIGRIGDRMVGFASVYGPAMASEITHVFGMLGTRRVIQTGVCGALGNGMLAGDLVIPTEAHCGEGAVACYVPGLDRVAATPALVSRAQALAGSDGAHLGPIWTTAALLAEGIDDLRRWREGGCIAVDMETATTFGVAEWTGMERIAVLSVFDNPLAGAHVALEEAEKTAHRERGEERMLEIVLGMVAGGEVTNAESGTPFRTYGTGQDRTVPSDHSVLLRTSPE
jgi:uridine phosphorylase